MTDLNHGTYGGYQAHRKAGQDACDDCKAAARDYVRQFRATRPDNMAAIERQRGRARTRALWRLKNIHVDEYHTLYVEEMTGEQL